MGHPHIRRKGLQSTRKKPLETDLENKWETNVVFLNTVDPSKTKGSKFYFE